MKNRNGFVSNSSSSSYIIKFPSLNLEKFSSMILSEYKWGWLNRNDIKGQIEKRLDNFGKILKEYDDDQDTHGIDRYRDIVSTLEEDSKTLDAIEEDDDAVLVKFILGFLGITVIESKDGLILDYFTTMHNDYIAGMGEHLAEIVLFFSFLPNIEIICERDENA